MASTMTSCPHRNLSVEDAGFEAQGIRQVIAVCHNCGTAGMHTDTVHEAYEAFLSAYPETETDYG